MWAGGFGLNVFYFNKLATLSKKSELAKAIRYSLNQWDALVLYGEEGRAEISNALAENALRCVSLGRLYFYGKGRPIHVSYAEKPQSVAYEMRESATGRRIPRSFSRN